jgi:predicted nucleic acid-binding protein
LIVLDASAVVPLLLDLPDQSVPVLRVMADRLGEKRGAPHLVDIEVANTLRRLTLRGELGQPAAWMALDDMRAFRMERYPHQLLLPRVWELRTQLSAYDAAYLALAEILDAPLITRDRAFLTVDSDAEIVLAV